MIVVDDMQTRNKLMPYSLGQQKVVECSHLIVFAAQTEPGNDMIDEYIHSVARVRQQSIDELNDLAEHMKSVFADMASEQKTAWAHQQVHIALGTMLTAAAVMQIDSCPMGGIEAAGYDQVLGLAERGLETSVICALGIRHPDDHSAHLEKVRYDQAEMVITI
jgi:nitroreductase